MAARAEYEGAGQSRRRRPLLSNDARLLAAVRRGDDLAFEVLYERHRDELLAYCRHMLGSLQDAEEAVQATFASAHRALLADDRPIEPRPWLYAIARNACLSMIRRRRVAGEGETPPPPEADPLTHLERQAEVRRLLGTIVELPERQRDALVMAEMEGLSHREIGEILGVRPAQVRSYVHQARANLHAELEARETDCETIRRQLASARGPALLKGNLRRHLRSCASCRAHAEALGAARGRLHALLPLSVLLALRCRAPAMSAGRRGVNVPSAAGSRLASPLVELGGGGGAALAAKALTGIALLGASAGAGTGLLGARAAPRSPGLGAAAQGHAPNAAALVLAGVSPAGGRDAAARGYAPGAPPEGPAAPAGREIRGTFPGARAPEALTPAPRGASLGAATATLPVGSHPKGEQGVGGGAGPKGPEAPHGKSEAPHGKSEAPHGSPAPPGKSEAPHGKSEAPHGSPAPPGKSEAPHGKSEAPHGKSEAPHGSPAPPGKSEAPSGKSGAPHGGAGAPLGKSEAPPGRSEAPHGSAGTPGKSEAPHGETPGKAEVPHGKPEMPPVKGGPGGKSEVPPGKR